ncbi:putative reverse transcriptase domain-containing protein [Tanacetum coccineum]
MEEWIKKIQEGTVINTRNQGASLKNLETQIEQLTKDVHAKAATEVPTSSVGNARQRIFECLDGRPLGASINVMPKSMFEHLKLATFKETNMLVEMANMTKKAPLGIIESILVKIDKFLFSSDFMIIDMLKTSNETMILGRPFLATIHAEIDIFNKEISLGIDSFDVEADYANMFANPYSRRFDEYKRIFINEVEQLSNEYELKIGKKKYVLDDVWENVNKTTGVQHTHGTMKDMRKKNFGNVGLTKPNMRRL